MKKVAILLSGVILLGFGSMVMAATNNANVQVSIAPVDELDVTDGGVINLTIVTGNSLTGTDDTTARLSYKHNSAINKQITAQVLAGGMPSGTQDITLTAALTGGENAVTLVTAGSRNLAAQVVETSIAAGTITNTVVTYGAYCTASGTRASTYTFVVTYTSSDAS